LLKSDTIFTTQFGTRACVQDMGNDII